MSQGDKNEEVELLGGTSTHPSLEESPSTDGFMNTFAKDDSSSISRHEYNDGMSAMKAHMNEVTNMLNDLMSRIPMSDNPVITPNIPKLGGGELTSQFRDDGRNENSYIPLRGNGSGVNSMVAPPLSYNSLPLPEPHFSHVGPPPILNKEAYPVWAYRMKRHLRGSSEELWRIIQDGFHPYDRDNMNPR